MKKTSKKYNSQIAETIEATGYFLNSVKRPGFILGFIAIIGFFVLGYMYLNNQKEQLRLTREQINSTERVKDELKQQNDMVAKQNNLLEEQNRITAEK